MNVRTRGRLAWFTAGASVALTTSGLILSYAFRVGDDPVLALLVLAAVLAMAPVGATIAAKAGNAVGWALIAVIVAVAIFVTADIYATYSSVVRARPLPFTGLAALLDQLAFFLALLLLIAIPLLYPTGTPRWRWVWRAYVTATSVLIGGFAILPQDLTLTGGKELANPYAIEALEGPVGAILGVAGATILACIVLSIVGLVLRYREARGDERQQIRWLAYLGIATVVGFVANMVVIATLGENSVAAGALGYALVVMVLLGIPAACAVAILKYHLYDLDIVIRKAVVFGLLAVFISIVYAGIVAGVGAFVSSSGSTALSFAAAAALAVLFQPARDRARKVADRLVYGKRATPYEVLAEFSGRVSETYASDDVLPRMAQVLQAGTGADSAIVWLKIGGGLRPSATSPVDAVAPSELPADAVEVRHQGELLGALSVSMPAADPMNPAKAKLVEDLASQAGLVLRNVRLIEELRASRQRIVAAQDEERRKIERNLHDGAQQQLVALQVKLRLAEQILGRDVAKAKEMLAQLGEDTGEALDNLRDLARGIYPPLLADKGLVAALESQARRAAVPVTVEAGSIGRFPQDTEAAVYFCCLEALQNVAKYAGATQVTLSLSDTDGSLSFEVIDDGAGFDSGETGYGTGLQGMADRLAALDGRLEVRSSPGGGTTVIGRVPRIGNAS